MKKLFITIALLFVLALPSWAATQSGSVNLNATIESPIIPQVISKTMEVIPVLGNVAPNCNQVTITWKTQYVITYKDGLTGVVTKTETIDANSSTEVGYGLVADTDNIVEGAVDSNHSVTLNDLVSRRNYKYYIKSSDGVLTQKNSGGTFNVSCDISNPSISVVAHNKGAKIDITYPSGADVARLVIRRSIVSAPASMTAGEAVYSGDPVDTYQDPLISLGHRYWYSVFICNGFNVCSEGTFGGAQRQVYAPTGFAATAGYASVSLSWRNPTNDTGTDFSFAAARLIRVAGNCASAGANDGQLLVQGDVSGFEDTNVTNGTTYTYKIFAKNSYNEYSSGVCISATPSPESEAQCISNISALSGNNWASLSWTNPASSASFRFNSVRWQRSNACVTSADSGQMVYNDVGQNFYDNGVINNTIYAYSAFVNYGDNKTVSCGCVAAMPKADDIKEENIDIPGITGGGGVVAGPDVNYGFYVAGGALKISTASTNVMYILPGYALTISVPRPSLPKPASIIVAQIGNKNYLINLDTAQNKYQTTFVAPDAPGEYQIRISTVYFDKTVANQTWKLVVLPWGYVSLDRKGLEKVSGARVVLKKDGVEYTGFGVANPQITKDDGYFGFMVPNSVYDVEITKDGLRPYIDKGIRVDNNVINFHANVAKDQNAIQAAIDALNNPQKIAENVSDIIKQNVTENKEVKTATVNVAAPTVVAVTGISTALAIPWWSLLHYLQYLFTEPLAWLFRRKKKGWGVVYNSITKEPVDLAVVRLYDKKTGKIIKSKITDRQGRYNFFVDEGEYYMEASKPHFTFPSLILKNATEDKKYLDLYHGQTILVKEGQEGVIIANIPIDQDDVTVSDRQILRQYFWQGIRSNVNAIGPIFSLATLIVFPGALTIIFSIVHLVMYLLFRRLAKKKHAKSWGVVYDNGTKQLLGKAVVRIFSPEYNKMLEVQITDRHGRYGFLAEDNQYYITGSKDGYSEYKSNTFDLSNRKESDIVGQDIALQRIAPVGAQPTLVAPASAPMPNLLTPATPVPPPIIQAQPTPPPPPPVETVEKEASPLEEMAAKIRQQAEQQQPPSSPQGFSQDIMEKAERVPPGADEDQFYLEKLGQKSVSPLDTIAQGVTKTDEVEPEAAEPEIMEISDDGTSLSMEEQLLLREVEKKFEAYKTRQVQNPTTITKPSIPTPAPESPQSIGEEVEEKPSVTDKKTVPKEDKYG